MIVNKYHILFIDNVNKLYQTEVVNASRMTEAINKCEAQHGFHIDIVKCVNINVLREIQSIADDVDVIKAEQEILWAERHNNNEILLQVRNNLGATLDYLNSVTESFTKTS